MIPRGFRWPAVAALLALLVGGCENTSRNPGAAYRSSTPEVLDVRYLTVLPQVVHRVAPSLPPTVRRRMTSGEVLVDFIVDETGQTLAVHAIRASNPDFGDAAVAAVMQWIFTPGQKDGRIVQTHMQVPIVFSATDM